MVPFTSSTAILQAAFPGRVALGPREVAQALHGPGKDTKKRIEAVRDALEQGTLIPGLRKSGARWSVPIAALGAAMDQRLSSAPLPPIVKGDDAPTKRPRRSKHATIGPRMAPAVQRSIEVWGEILEQFLILEGNDLRQRLSQNLPQAAEGAPPRPRLFVKKD